MGAETPGYPDSFPWEEAVRALIAWYEGAARDLPWRRTREPYAVWISEAMLQQTRVGTALPYYLRFMARFPTLESLSMAPADEVLKAWEGLGYYRRAENLRLGASRILSSGGWPTTAHALREIPGIGPYTAGALASICFGEAAPILDGNVRRVWCRLFAMDGVADVGNRKALWALSARAVLRGPAGTVNQALMELGAILCTPRSPDCPSCPLGSWCASKADGRAEERPMRPKKRQLPVREAAVGLIWEGGRFLVQRRANGGLLPGMWELPGGKIEEDELPARALLREIQEEVGVRVAVGRALAPVRHTFSHFKLRLHAFHCSLLAGQPKILETPSRRWIHPEEVTALPFPAATHKVFRMATFLTPRYPPS